MQYFSWRKARWNNCTSSSSQTSHCLASPQQSLVTVQVQTDTLPSHQKVCINRDMWKMNFEVICFCIVSQVTWLRLPLLHLWRYRFQANQHEMTSSLSPPHPHPPQFDKICNSFWTTSCYLSSHTAITAIAELWIVTAVWIGFLKKNRMSIFSF